VDNNLLKFGGFFSANKLFFSRHSAAVKIWWIRQMATAEGSVWVFLKQAKCKKIQIKPRKTKIHHKNNNIHHI